VELFEIFFSKFFFIAFCIRNVSFAVVSNGRDRSVVDVIICSSIPGSESTDLESL
jgi:hypothetical protein